MTPETPEQISKVSPSGEMLTLDRSKSVRAGPWSKPDHLYRAACGCQYDIRAHDMGEGWAKVCPVHRGKIQYIDSPAVRDILPYGGSSEEYLSGCIDPAFIAFLEGRDYHPSTYEYGTNAGDYSSPLVSERGNLWYYRVRQQRATKCAIIATRGVA